MNDVAMLERVILQDESAAAGLYDALQEQGVKPRTARKRVNLLTAQARVNADSRLRTAIREAAGHAGHLSPITVVHGMTAPVGTGRHGYSFRRGSRWKRIPSTLEITVGAGWILAHS